MSSFLQTIIRILTGGNTRRLAAGVLLTLALAGCAFLSRGRCFIEESRYDRMKTLFIQSNSLQQVEQAMKAEGWSICERNEFRYRLNKDLNLEPPPEPEALGAELLP